MQNIPDVVAQSSATAMRTVDESSELILQDRKMLLDFAQYLLWAKPVYVVTTELQNLLDWIYFDDSKLDHSTIAALYTIFTDISANSEYGGSVYMQKMERDSEWYMGVLWYEEVYDIYYEDQKGITDWTDWTEVENSQHFNAWCTEHHYIDVMPALKRFTERVKRALVIFPI
jgi:hypothetical protein